MSTSYHSFDREYTVDLYTVFTMVRQHCRTVTDGASTDGTVFTMVKPAKGSTLVIADWVDAAYLFTSDVKPVEVQSAGSTVMVEALSA